MKKKLIVIIVLMLLISVAIPSTGHIARNFIIKESNENNPILNDNNWVKYYGGGQGEHCNYVMQTDDGGYILVGETRSYGNGESDIWLIKADAEGNKIWDKVYGGNDYEYGKVVQQTSDGGYILASATESFGPDPGSLNMWLFKTDSNGNILWELFGTGDERIYDVKETNDGGYIFVGSIKGALDSDGTDLYILKIDEDGNTLWEKVFDNDQGDQANSIDKTHDGGYVICGSTYSAPPRNYAIWLIKTDSNAEMEWNKSFKATIYASAKMVHQTSDGGFLITGTRALSEEWPNNEDIWLIKTDSEGNKVWEKVFGSEADDEPYSVFETNDGNYFVAGNQGRELPLYLNWYDILLVKFSVDGNELWKKTIGGLTNEGIRSAQQTSDGGFILGGYKFNFTVGSSPVILLMKTDSEGNVPYSRAAYSPIDRSFKDSINLFPMLRLILKILV